MITLCCRGREGFPHRRVVVYAYDGPLPIPFDRTSFTCLELRCTRCGYAPRVSEAELSALLNIASFEGGQLDIPRCGPKLKASPPVEG